MTREETCTCRHRGMTCTCTCTWRAPWNDEGGEAPLSIEERILHRELRHLAGDMRQPWDAGHAVANGIDVRVGRAEQVVDGNARCRVIRDAGRLEPQVVRIWQPAARDEQHVALDQLSGAVGVAESEPHSCVGSCVGSHVGGSGGSALGTCHLAAKEEAHPLRLKRRLQRRTCRGHLTAQQAR